MPVFESAAELKSEHCINRELSWLEFNQRVLNEAVSPDNPPFERMKFLSIVSSNLDEFFMIRVASLWDQIDAGYTRPDVAGMTPRQQIAAITARVRVMVRSMYDALRKEVLPSLDRAGIRVKSVKNLSDAQTEFVDRYFEQQVYPVLTPMAVDSRRPRRPRAACSPSSAPVAKIVAFSFFTSLIIFTAFCYEPVYSSSA